MKGNGEHHRSDVIVSTLLVVAQGRKGCRHALEGFIRSRSSVLIWMQLQRQLHVTLLTEMHFAVGLFDFCRGGCFLHAQDFVVVNFAVNRLGQFLLLLHVTERVRLHLCVLRSFCLR